MIFQLFEEEIRTWQLARSNVEPEGGKNVDGSNDGSGSEGPGAVHNSISPPLTLTPGRS